MKSPIASGNQFWFNLFVFSSFKSFPSFRLYRRAIDSIAGSLAYVRVALKRFQDNVPLHIQYHMIDKFANECEDVLKREFGIFHKSPEEVHHFFQEDTRTEQKRENLLRRKVRQECALELILNHEKMIWIGW